MIPQFKRELRSPVGLTVHFRYLSIFSDEILQIVENYLVHERIGSLYVFIDLNGSFFLDTSRPIYKLKQTIEVRILNKIKDKFEDAKSPESTITVFDC